MFGGKMAELSGADVAALSSKLAGTLNFDDLQLYVHASTGDQLYKEYVGEGKPLRVTIADLLKALEELGITAIFLRYVYDRRPGKPDVQQLIIQLCPDILTVPQGSIALSAQIRGAVQPNAPTNALAPGLQRNVRPNLAKLDIRVWQRRLIETERRVCMVELDRQGLGTGFLIGPDTVLTNWHVVEDAKGAGRLNELGCRFDYVQLADGSRQAGQLVLLHADGFVSFSSPYTAAEKTGNAAGSPPTLDELDYAVLRLVSSVGAGQIDGAKRGWIALPSAALPLPKDAPLLIVQHPEGLPMKLALDTQAVIGPNPNHTRILYRTNTEPGSSGSPCFTMDWDVVALHQYGDPKWQQPLFNQGVPIELIRQHIVTKGLVKILGQ